MDRIFTHYRVFPEAWQEHPDVRYLSGHKQTRQMRVAKMDNLNDWEGFVEAAQALGIEKPTLSGFAIIGRASCRERV